MSTASQETVLQRMRGCSLAILCGDFVKKTGEKLDYSTGHVANAVMGGFKCKDLRILCVLVSLFVNKRHVGARNELCIYCRKWKRVEV